MYTARISLLVAIALIVAACGSGVTAPEGPQPIPDPTAPPTTTTTVVDGTTTPDGTAAPEPPVTTTTTVPDTTVPDSANDAATQTGDTEVFVYLLTGATGSHDYGCGYVTPVTRLVQSPALLSGALDALLAGPTEAEIAAGQGSWFQDDVGWELSSVTISNGVAYIDLTEDSQPIPNASTSCGSMALMAQLDYTATQFPTVDRAVYSFNGDVEAFYHWLQRDVPQL